MRYPAVALLLLFIGTNESIAQTHGQAYWDAVRVLRSEGVTGWGALEGEPVLLGELADLRRPETTTSTRQTEFGDRMWGHEITHIAGATSDIVADTFVTLLDVDTALVLSAGYSRGRLFDTRNLPKRRTAFMWSLATVNVEPRVSGGRSALAGASEGAQRP